tara:strand:+ start:343 stop:573 length:231 start_codon:yes stop_codon:yes gene_type:complete
LVQIEHDGWIDRLVSSGAGACVYKLGLPAPVLAVAFVNVTEYVGLKAGELFQMLFEVNAADVPGAKIHRYLVTDAS